MLAPGDRVGRFVLLRRIGEVGADDIWDGEDPDGRRRVLRARDAHRENGPDFARMPDRFHERASGWLLRVEEQGRSARSEWLVSERGTSDSLSDLVAEGARQGVRLAPELAAYLVHHAAHGFMALLTLDPGFSSGPLLPALEALRVDPAGRVEVVPFAAAREVTEEGHEAGLVDPERRAGGPCRPQGIVFSLGVVLEWLMLGPSSGATGPTGVSWPTPGAWVADPGKERGLAKIVHKCLARRREDRFSDPRLLAAAIERALEGTAGAGPDAAARWRQRILQGSNRPGAISPQAPSRSPPRPLPPDLGHGRYEVRRRLGSGGMGEVYEVYDRELDDVLALKRIPAETSSSRDALERLKREIRLARRIASPNVCRVHDLVDLGEGERGLTMGLVPGRTLASHLRDGLSIDFERFARWGADIADGLAAAHGLEILHRDLKPENVMIKEDDDSAVLLDFGIARERTEPRGTITEAGIILGTPLYMSPEQLTNRDLDGRSDLFSLGLILAELITGYVPAGGAGYSEVLDRRVVHAQRIRTASLHPGVPRALGDAIDRLLSSSPNDRIATATAVKDRLRSFAEGRPPTAPRSGEARLPGVEARPAIPSPGRSSERPSPRPRATFWDWLPAATLLSILATVLSLWYFVVLPSKRGPPHPTTAAPPPESTTPSRAPPTKGPEPTRRDPTETEIEAPAPPPPRGPSDRSPPRLDDPQEM